MFDINILTTKIASTNKIIKTIFVIIERTFL